MMGLKSTENLPFCWGRCRWWCWRVQKTYHLVEEDVDDGVEEYREFGEEEWEHSEGYMDVLNITIFHHKEGFLNLLFEPESLMLNCACSQRKLILCFS
jgi:hypothetical protein